MIQTARLLVLDTLQLTIPKLNNQKYNSNKLFIVDMMFIPSTRDFKTKKIKQAKKSSSKTHTFSAKNIKLCTILSTSLHWRLPQRQACTYGLQTHPFQRNQCSWLPSVRAASTDHFERKTRLKDNNTLNLDLLQNLRENTILLWPLCKTGKINEFH